MKKPWCLLLLVLVLTTVDCRKSLSSSSRRKSKNTGTSSSGTGTSSSSGGWFSWGSNSKTNTGAVSNPKPADTNYGWNKGVTGGGNTGVGSTNTRTGQTYGWTNPSSGTGNKPASGVQTGTGGWSAGTANKPASGVQTGQSGQNWNTNNKPNAPPPPYTPYDPKKSPSSNIGPGGYPVQPGHPSSGGYNTGFQTSGHNTGYNTGGYNRGYQPSGYQQPGFNNYGHNTGYSGNHYTPSQHGFASSNYPSQNNFGYPGQGMFGGSNSPKYGGMGIFGGGSGHYGYPSGGSSWGSPSYGSGGFGQKSGSGSMLKGLAIGAAGGYLTSSLIHKISNPWGASGYGYGNSYGYDRGSWRRDRYESTTAAPQKNPENDWIHCVAIDPVSKTTLINPNCSCTVTTITDPITNQPISTHNCTTANGQVVMQPPNATPPPIGAQQQQPVFGSPNAGVDYGNIQGYGQGNGQYGYGQPSIDPRMSDTVASSTQETSTESSSQTPTSDIPASERQVSGADISRKRSEFYSQLEKLVNMGKFSP